MDERINYERAAILEFENIAQKHGLRVFKKQGADNRIFLGGNLYFQFGDLRVNTPTHHVVIEAESAGGATNLVKYWYCLADETLCKQILKPIILLHLFRQSSESDYGAHLKLWDFLSHEMNKVLGSRIQTFRYVYREPLDLTEAFRKFEQSISL